MNLQGQAHSKWASRSQHTRDVVEIIDTARDNLDQDKIERQAGIVDEEASSDSDSSEEEKEELPDGSADQKQGVIDQVRSYKRRDKALHRQHRGLMQWKVRRPVSRVPECDGSLLTCRKKKSRSLAQQDG